MTVTALHPGRMAASARGDLAERMVDAAGDLAILVRDEGPDAIAEHLARYTQREKDTLLVVLAAMVPIDDATKADLLAWVTWDEHGDAIEGVPPPALPARPEQPPAGQAEGKRLTPRERRILDYADLKAQGFTPAQAAEWLGVSMKTIYRYDKALSGPEEAARAAA